MIWSFKRKRHLDRSFNKCKSRLYYHGGQQQWNINIWDTYALVVSWSSVRILLTLSKIHNFYTKSVDFVQAYPSSDIKSSIFLKYLAGVVLNNNDGKLVLYPIKYLYGLKDAGRPWFEHLIDGLIHIGLAATSNDPCILIKGSDIIILYVDDCIIMLPTKAEADRIFDEIEQRGYKIIEEGTMEEYLGIMFDHNDDRSFCMSQPFFIEHIINSIPGMAEARSTETPAFPA